MIPIATDQAPRRTPIVTLWLIGLNLLAYLTMLAVVKGSEDATETFILRFGMSREAFAWWQPVTYLFVHDPGSLWHVGGNMIFLWTFGSAVEGRLGATRFLSLYLIGGILAGLAQIMTSSGPVVGASGAVSAVTGAFVVLFPRARVSVWLFLSIIPIPAMLMVGLYFFFDLAGAFGGGRGGIGYLAHVTGTIFGFVVAMSLLGTGVLRRTDLDLLFLLKQWRRRREMRKVAEASRSAAGPWASLGKDGDERVTSSSVGSAHANTPLSAATKARIAQRARESASEAFAKGDFERAITEFNRSFETVPTGAEADEARLMLAVIHIRKVPDHARAREAIAAIGAALPERLRPLIATLEAELKP